MSFPKRYLQIHTQSTNGWNNAQNIHWYRIVGEVFGDWLQATTGGNPVNYGDPWQDMFEQTCTEAYADWPVPLAGYQTVIGTTNQAWCWLYDDDFNSTGITVRSGRSCRVALGPYDRTEPRGSFAFPIFPDMVVTGHCAVVRRVTEFLGRGRMGRYFHGGLAQSWVDGDRLSGEGMMYFTQHAAAFSETRSVELLNPTTFEPYTVQAVPCLCSYKDQDLIPITQMVVNSRLGYRDKYEREEFPAFRWYEMDHAYPR